LSPARYKVSFTASAELHDKLERLQALMSSSGNPADLPGVIEAAVTEKLESKRYGKSKAPRRHLESSDTSGSSRHIPAAVRRAVFERDGGRCNFEDETGRRCTETRRLEYHHIRPYGRGGDHSAENIALRCRVHNLLEAECDYGKEVVDRYRRSGDRVSELGAFYTFSNRATSLPGVAPGLPP
jgi:5-methylcytosine-specific restriction endonuclease McrA